MYPLQQTKVTTEEPLEDYRFSERGETWARIGFHVYEFILFVLMAEEKDTSVLL